MREETGFSPVDRQTIIRRSYGQCERCNKSLAAHIHHRKPRRMGGRRGGGFADVNRPSNGVALCAPCHQWAETGNRRAAQNFGLILSEHEDPATTPVFLPRYRGWVLLTDTGDVNWHQDEHRARNAGQQLNEQEQE